MQVFPGVIDCHAHFQTPGYTHRETFETGSRAAAAGGVTCVVDMPLNNRPPTIDAPALELKLSQIEGQAYTDYALWGGLVDDNLAELDGLYRGGVAAFKAFLPPVKEGSFTNITLYQALRGMEKLAGYGLLLGLHCEDYSLIAEGKKQAVAEGRYTAADFLGVHSVLAEKLAVAEALLLCEQTRCRLHICHVSHPEVARLIRQAQKKGLPVTAETCPHYLGLSERTLFEKGPLAKCTPPLRPEEAGDALWDYLLDGTLSCIGSDHSPATPEEKDASKSIWEAWGGLNAVQYYFPFMYDLAITKRGLNPRLLARTMALNPAKIFGLADKGDIRPGMDADLVVVDPARRWRAGGEDIQTMHGCTVFEGMEGTGAPVYTLLRGVLTAQNGRFEAQAQGTGRFLPGPGYGRA